MKSERTLIAMLGILILLICPICMAKEPLPEIDNPPRSDSAIFLQGGDTFEDAVAIPAGDYPVTIYGTTEGYTNDYDEACPYTGSNSPDVVYYINAPDHCYPSSIVSLCNSSYDTKLYMYLNEYTPGSPWACNDDSPECFQNSYRSELDGLFFSEYDEKYYIVVDGYGGEYGEYELQVIFGGGYGPCLECIPGAIREDEDFDGSSDWVDIYNGGCDTDPDNPPIQFLPGDENDSYTLCGYLFEIDWQIPGSVDSDWFSFIAGESGYVTVSFRSASDAELFVMNLDCDNPEIYQYTSASAYATYTIEFTQASGSEGRLRVYDENPSLYGNKYNLVLTGIDSDEPSPATSATWGAIKKNYHSE